MCEENERLPMSSAAIIGIVVGAIVAVLIVCGVVFCIIMKNRGKKAQAAHPREVEMEEETA